MNKNCVRTVIIALVLGFIPILGMKKLKIAPKIKVPSSVQGSLLNTKRFLSNEKAIAQERQKQNRFLTNNPVVENQPEEAIEPASARVQNIKNYKNYIKNDRGSIDARTFSDTYFATVPSLFKKYGAQTYSIKREDGESSDKEFGQRNKGTPKPTVRDLLNEVEGDIRTTKNMLRILEIVLLIVAAKVIYTVYEGYTNIDIVLGPLEQKLATSQKNLPLILNNSFKYSSSQWNYPEVEQHIINFAITRDTYNYNKIKQQFYSALADAFKQKNIKTVTPDDILNLIEETENTLKEGIFKDAVCINRTMNPLAALYLKQTTQLLKGESAYILGTLGYIKHIKAKNNNNDIDYFIQRLNAPWWKKAFYFFN